SFAEISSETVSGSQTYWLAPPLKELDVEAVSGSITVYLSKNTGFTAELDTLSGSISSDFAEMNGRRQARYGDGSAALRFESVSGSVSIMHDAALDATPKPAKESTPAPTATTAPTTKGEPIPSSHRKY
ncbi:hypothetical protein LJC74_09160, partial [Eubacteriales bacterium OttesenSCG-928-A19]|nr:hypothetical protein [Eubacteriales bacterium OttesenSCG-928-A19]